MDRDTMLSLVVESSLKTSRCRVGGRQGSMVYDCVLTINGYEVCGRVECDAGRGPDVHDVLGALACDPARPLMQAGFTDHAVACLVSLLDEGGKDGFFQALSCACAQVQETVDDDAVDCALCRLYQESEETSEQVASVLVSMGAGKDVAAFVAGFVPAGTTPEAFCAACGLARPLDDDRLLHATRGLHGLDVVTARARAVLG